MNIEKCISCNQRMSSAVKELKDSELKELDKNTHQYFFTENNEIFKQGEVAENIFYLKEGIVKLSVRGIEKDKIVKIIKAPNYIGLASVFNNSAFSFTATTLSKSVICVTDKEVYIKLIDNNNKFALEMIKLLSENILMQHNSCVSLIQQNLNGRIASCLINLSENIFMNNKISIKRKDLSEIVCQTRENISRIMSQLSKDGIIKYDRDEIEILDMTILKQISQFG